MQINKNIYIYTVYIYNQQGKDWVHSLVSYYINFWLLISLVDFVQTLEDVGDERRKKTVFEKNGVFLFFIIRLYSFYIKLRLLLPCQ